MEEVDERGLFYVCQDMLHAQMRVSTQLRTFHSEYAAARASLRDIFRRLKTHKQYHGLGAAWRPLPAHVKQSVASEPFQIRAEYVQALELFKEKYSKPTASSRMSAIELVLAAGSIVNERVVEQKVAEAYLVHVPVCCLPIRGVNAGCR